MNALRLIASSCLIAILGSIQVGCGKKDGGTSSGGGGGNGKAAELILGKWVHEKSGTVITLEFSAKTVKGTWKADGSGPSFDGTYSVLDESTVEMPKFGAAFEDKVKIESITKDKLVLSGFSYKAGTYEFTRPGGSSGSGTVASDTDRVMWIHSEGRFVKTGNNWVEDGKRGDEAWHFEFIETKRTPEFVELYDKSRDTFVQLHSDRCMVKFPGEENQKFYDGLWVTPKAPPGASGSIKDKLVGTWKMVKFTGELEFGRVGDTVTFTKGGRINKSGKNGNFSYKLDGDKITSMEATPEGGVLSMTLTTKFVADDKLVILFSGQTEGLEFQRMANVPTRDTDKLMGTWEAPKTNDFPFDVALQFTKDGKLKMTLKAPKAVVKDSTYTHDGDTINITRKEGGKEEKDAWTITALEDKKLVIVDEHGKKTEYKRIK